MRGFFIQKNIKRNALNRGFTLVETIVAVGLFVAVFISISGSFLSVIGAYKKVTSERVNIDNLGTAMESMVRGIKTGVNFHCGASLPLSDPQDCAISGDTYFAFWATNPGRRVVYNFTDTGTGKRLYRSDNNGVDFYPVTENTSALQITYLRFYVSGTAIGTVDAIDPEQPKIIIIMKGVSGLGSNASTFSLQTTIVQHSPDVP